MADPSKTNTQSRKTETYKNTLQVKSHPCVFWGTCICQSLRTPAVYIGHLLVSLLLQSWASHNHKVGHLFLYLCHTFLASYPRTSLTLLSVSNPYELSQHPKNTMPVGHPWTLRVKDNGKKKKNTHSPFIPKGHHSELNSKMYPLDASFAFLVTCPAPGTHSVHLLAGTLPNNQPLP